MRQLSSYRLRICQLGSHRNSISRLLARVADVDNGRYRQSKQPFHFATTALVFNNWGKRLHPGPLSDAIQPFVFYEIREVLAIAGYEQRLCRRALGKHHLMGFQLDMEVVDDFTV